MNDEGRHAIRSSSVPFDVIVMHAIDTYAATASCLVMIIMVFWGTRHALALGAACYALAAAMSRRPAPGAAPAGI